MSEINVETFNPGVSTGADCVKNQIVKDGHISMRTVGSGFIPDRIFRRDKACLVST
ncbi:MAG: hypothetical protein PVG39_04620 [Desulfobacteraceae bacterium]